MIEGSCLCGAIKYQVELIPNMIFNCHCKFCRKAHGADYVTVVIANGNTLTISDKENNLREHLSGAGGYRAFCSICGTRLMNYAPDKSLYLCVTLSTIDTPLGVKPDAHVNTESKAGWCVPYEGIPSFPKLPENLL